MLTFGAPLLLAAAAFAALGVAGLHLLRRSERRPAPLPTARFIPPQAASTFVRMSRINDAWLLALRVGALLLAGAGMARPVISWRSAETARVILVDRSRSVASAQRTMDVLASIRSSPGRDRVIAFDSVPAPAADAVDSAALTPSMARGSLSAALVAGVREAARLQSRYREVQLHLISPPAVEEMDAATSAIRSQWRGTITIHRVAPPSPVPAHTVVETALTVDDIVGAAIRNALPVVASGEAGSLRDGVRDEPAPASRGSGTTSEIEGGRVAPDATARRDLPPGSIGRGVAARMVRGRPTVADSAWARERGRVLVLWPATDVPDDSLRALASDSGAAIGHLSAFPLAQPVGGESRSIVWWSDGRAAAVESSLGDGCIRDVGFVPVRAGDFALSLAFRRIVQRLAAPCGAASVLQPLPDDAVAALGAPSASSSIPRVAPRPAASPLASWLLGAALITALLELLLRRDASRPVAVDRARMAA